MVLFYSPVIWFRGNKGVTYMKKGREKERREGRRDGGREERKKRKREGKGERKGCKDNTPKTYQQWLSLRFKDFSFYSIVPSELFIITKDLSKKMYFNKNIIYIYKSF